MSLLNRSLWFYLLTGLCQGLVFWQFETLKTLGAGGLAASLTLVLVGGVFLQLLGPKLRNPRVLALTLVFCVLTMSVSSWVVVSAMEHGNRWLTNTWLLTCVPLSYVVCAFLASWPSGEGRSWRYDDLFQYAWSHVFVVFFALTLTSVFGLLLLLWSKLFLMLGIEFFAELFSSPMFFCLSGPVVFSLTIRLGLNNEKVIGMLRGVFLAACHFLLPMITLITVLFTVTLPFTGLQQIWATGYSTPILLCLVGTYLFLLNGVFQDGHQAQPYPAWLMRCVEAGLVCLPVLVVVAGYSSWLRIEQYGLSPRRFVSLLLVVVIAAYSLAATCAVVQRQTQWLEGLRRSNPALALAVCVVLVLINTPWLNAQSFSARDQVQRLLDGRTSVLTFDTNYLRNGLGVSGRQQFEALSERLERNEILDAPSREVLRTQMKQTPGETTFKYPPAEPTPVNIEWVGPKVDGSEQFVSLNSKKRQCQDDGCVMWAADLDGDGQVEVLQFNQQPWDHRTFLYKRAADGEWKYVTVLQGANVTPQHLDHLRAGEVKLIEPRFKNVQIGTLSLVPEPEDQ
ncbi:DUF4153 domain-containing protein [Pseudomonas sp. LT1P18]|uniref:DUF4153 domain-containing protein n=1 Tax=Pseudomonas arabinosi TaxID=3398357 RepID=UPI0039EE05E2